ncbi:DUF2187 family protein [Bacillus massilinigeriensis]|uniref:DUF2187 family protein n=1 Tax=Bacillus massilionigeriensis TaxID=1805475 RepID=UPI001570B0D6|nr:DUF2187 family protein [Bacillus massilionigeriensis]
MEEEIIKESKESKKVKKAKEGDQIEIIKGVEKGKKGKVVVVRENSVIVEIGRNVKKDEPIKTVVNHQNYKFIR